MLNTDQSLKSKLPLVEHWSTMCADSELQLANFSPPHSLLTNHVLVSTLTCLPLNLVTVECCSDYVF